MTVIVEDDMQIVLKRVTILVVCDPRLGSGTFSPLSFPDGRIYLDITTSIPQSSFAELAPFELYRNVMIILGTVDATEYAEDAGQEERLVEDGSRNVFYHRAHDSFISTMENVQEQYPGVLLTQLLIMDLPSTDSKPWIPEGSLHLPPVDQSNSSTMHDLLAGIIGKLLGEMSVYAEQVRSWATVATPLSLHAQSQRFDLERRPDFNRRISDRSHLSRDESPTGDSNHRASPRPVSQAFNSPATSVASSPRPDSPALRSEAPSSPDLSNIETPTSSTAADAMWKARAKYASMQSDKPSGRSLYPATNAAMSADKEKNIGKARVGIVMGSLYMMTGRWSDAWRELLENAGKCKTHSDYIWLAAGLERIVCCMLLLGSEGFPFQVPSLCFLAQERQSTLYFIDAARDVNTAVGARDAVAANATLRKLGGSLGEVVNTLLHYYDRAGTFTGEALPQVSFSEMILRLMKLQAFVGTKAPLVNEHIFECGSLDALRRPIGAKEASDLTRLGISETVFRAYPGPFADISFPSRTGVLAGIASVLATLKMDRKRAMVLRDLITLIVPSLQQARTLGAAELGIHPSNSLSYTNGSSSTSMQDMDGTSVRQLLQQLLGIYAVGSTQKDKIPTSLSEQIPDYESLVHSVAHAAAQAASLDEPGSINLKIDILRSSIEFCESLPDPAGVAHNAAILLRTAGPQASIDPTSSSQHVWLANEEQVRLVNHIMTAVSSAREAGIQIEEPRYWDDFLLRSVQLVEDETNSRLVEHSKADISTAKKGPFLHEAWGKQAAKQEENLAIAGEPVALGVVLQNPYDFEIEIDEISICAEGGDIEIEQPNAILGPGRLEEIVCYAKVAEPGQIRILGCTIKVAGCREQFFPIYNDEWKAQEQMKLKEASRELSLREVSITDTVEDGKQNPTTSLMALTVIPRQPLLVLEDYSLTDQSLMLLEGETQLFTLTLRNISAIDVDFLRPSFDDALTTTLRSAVTSKDLSRADLFEVEASLTSEAFFHARRLDSPESRAIASGDAATFEISITGRTGTKDARVLFDFARLETEETEKSGRFFTRQLAIPVNVTVNAALQVQHFEITNLPLDAVFTNSGAVTNDIDGHREESKDSRHLCLLVMDVRNAWSNPAEVEFELGGTAQPVGRGQNARVHRSVVLPGQSHRFAIPMQKLFVQKADAQIPWLSAQSRRQFVVSGNGDTPDHERSVRELFWYREELLKNLQARWREEATGRHGVINLRSVQIGHRNVQALRVEDVDIELEVVQDQNTAERGSTGQTGRSSFDVQTGDFLTLRARLRNLSDKTIHGILRTQPALSSQVQEIHLESVARKFIWSGILQRPLPVLRPGATQTCDLGFSIVADGIYEIGAVFEEIRPSIPATVKKEDQGADEDDELDEAKYLSSVERRIWKMSEPCIVRARDSDK
ncbi:Transport protein Trs120 or TRAPPC9, TRAPP II complex subunit-like protein [Elsinoe fawcettii]|nr:Transport protein Trs120 or TRAPPC9, TRAPP II complex subunit-like protein [Elsinoe fawcettii]